MTPYWFTNDMVTKAIEVDIELELKEVSDAINLESLTSSSF